MDAENPGPEAPPLLRLSGARFWWFGALVCIGGPTSSGITLALPRPPGFQWVDFVSGTTYAVSLILGLFFAMNLLLEGVSTAVRISIRGKPVANARAGILLLVCYLAPFASLAVTILVLVLAHRFGR